MSPVTFSVVPKMSGMASIAIRSPIPSAGIPIVATSGEMTSNHPFGTPGALKLVRIPVKAMTKSCVTNAHRPQGFGSDRAAPTCHTDALRGFLHDVPNRLYRHAISPRPSCFVDPEEQPSSIDCGCGEPIVQFGSHPNGNRNRSNVACLAHQINNGPMLFALLERAYSSAHGGLLRCI